MAKIEVSAKTVEWLLAEANPPVRYLTLTGLLERSHRTKAVREAASQLGDYPPTRKILARHERFWKPGEDLYAKYKGGFWQLIFLHEYLAPKDNPDLRAGIEFLLSILEFISKDRPLYGVHCLNGNLLRAMVGLGFGDDPRVRDGLELVAGDVIKADGVPCVIADWSVYPTCSMSLPKVLLALTALPVDQRSRKVKRAIGVCRKRLLDNRIQHYVSPIAGEWSGGGRTAAGLPEPTSMQMLREPTERARAVAAKAAFVTVRGGLGERLEKPGWRDFSFPGSYDTDVLEAMRALVQAAVPKRSPELVGAIDLILAKRRPDGRWLLDGSLNKAMIASIESKGRPSRWITYYALWVLKYFRGLDIEGE